MNKVSIIIPVFNAISYLDRCVMSVLEQTYPNIEVILVDDGSTDGSSEICDKYTKVKDSVVVLHQKNQGPALARKHGIQIAKGEYVLFVDADDWINKKMIERLMTEVMQTKGDMICSQFVRVKDSGELIHESYMKEEAVDCVKKEDNIHHFFKTRYINGSCGGKLIKRVLFENIQINEESKIGEDISMIVALLLQAKQVRVINKELYNYYWNTSSISHTGYTEGHRNGLLNYIQLRDSLLREYPIEQKAIAGYFAEYEMAVITAMCRNKCYNKDAIYILRNDLYQNRVLIRKNKGTPIYMKICAGLIVIEPTLFIALFRCIHKLTGR